MWVSLYIFFKIGLFFIHFETKTIKSTNQQTNNTLLTYKYTFLDCMSPLIMENDKIPDSSITASSVVSTTEAN